MYAISFTMCMPTSPSAFVCSHVTKIKFYFHHGWLPLQVRDALLTRNAGADFEHLILSRLGVMRQAERLAWASRVDSLPAGICSITLLDLAEATAMRYCLSFYRRPVITTACVKPLHDGHGSIATQGPTAAWGPCTLAAGWLSCSSQQGTATVIAIPEASV